jgi:polygalacturonase
MGDGIIDGRGWAKVLGKDVTWWQLAESARNGGEQHVPRLIVTDHTDNLVIYRITLKNSANFHLVPHNSNGITIWGMKIDTSAGARNTDGFDPSDSDNITITQSYIRDGDDDIAIKSSKTGVHHMSVVHNHFYWGHGMSIGSETSGGVDHLLVRDLSIDGADNGIRIKSASTRGGLVNGVLYDDVCLRNIKKEPITLTTNYEGRNGGDKLPVFKNIILHNVRLSGGGKILIQGFDATHRITMQLDGVYAFDGPSQYKPNVQHADLLYGPGPMNLLLAGTDSTISGRPGTGTLASCEQKFVPFPSY